MSGGVRPCLLSNSLFHFQQLHKSLANDPGGIPVAHTATNLSLPEHCDEVSVRTLSHVTTAAAEDCGELSQRQQWPCALLRSRACDSSKRLGTKADRSPAHGGLLAWVFRPPRQVSTRQPRRSDHTTGFRGRTAVLLSSPGTPASTPASCLPGNGTSQESTCEVVSPPHASIQAFAGRPTTPSRLV